MLKFMNVFSASAKTTNECILELRTEVEGGLQTAEVHRRLSFSGYNEFEVTQKESLFNKYLEQVEKYFINFLKQNF